jgi:ClpP protease-like protein
MGTAPTLPKEVYATFSGSINADALQRITKAFDIAMNGKVQHVHLFFHTSGGVVGDGVSLYSYFKALPIKLTVYNPGMVASIGVVSYLGAAHRITSKHAIFMIHRTQCNIPQEPPPFEHRLLSIPPFWTTREPKQFSKNVLRCPPRNGTTSKRMIFISLRKRQLNTESRKKSAISRLHLGNRFTTSKNAQANALVSALLPERVSLVASQIVAESVRVLALALGSTSAHRPCPVCFFSVLGAGCSLLNRKGCSE